MSHGSVAAAAGLAAALLMPAAPATAEDAPICHVGYTTNGDATNFTARIVITNTSRYVINGWTLRFTLPPGQTFRNGWEARWEVVGQEVTSHSLAYNSVVDSDRSVSVGFYATGPVNGPRPAQFRVNDHLCAAG